MPKPLIVASLLLLVVAGCVHRSINYKEEVPEDCLVWEHGYTEYMTDGSAVTRIGRCYQTR